MRVLITGGYGFIGAWIIRDLLARGDSVWVYDLKEDARRLRLILPEEKVKQVTFVLSRFELIEWCKFFDVSNRAEGFP